MKLIKILLSFAFASGVSASALAASSDAVVLDVRTPEEYSESHVKGARNIDVQNPEFRTEIEKLDRTKNYVVYCRSGNRSGQALKIMRSMGFKNVENLGSVSNASKALKIKCEGKTDQC